MSVPLRPFSIVLGVAGGIAAYKACLLLRLLTEAGHTVRVVPTEAALRFVGAPTWEALSGQPVSTSVFDDVPGVQHVRLGQAADLVIVAPATADFMARAAAGRADDLLAATLLTASCPVVMCPAMHTEMWEHAATQANVRTLRARGVHILEPAHGRLTGVDSGAGRLPEPAAIVDFITHVMAPAPQDLVGTRVVVTAGGTQEPLDPVRFLGNRSSGKQGVALAAAAAQRGAQVTLIACNVSIDLPPGVHVLRVSSTAELAAAVSDSWDQAHVVIMAAAVADFRPAEASATKIKKTPGEDREWSVRLVQNPDILRSLVERRGGASLPVLVGFAAETGGTVEETLTLARTKLQAKGCDLLVANDVSGGAIFGEDHTAVHVLVAGQEPPRSSGAITKEGAAHLVLDVLAEWLQAH